MGNGRPTEEDSQDMGQQLWWKWRPTVTHQLALDSAVWSPDKYVGTVADTGNDQTNIICHMSCLHTVKLRRVRHMSCLHTVKLRKVRHMSTYILSSSGK